MRYFKIVREEINIQKLINMIKSPGSGAIVIFIGNVRDHTGDKRVLYLDYYAQEELAQNVMNDIFESVEKKWGEVDIAVEHRVGEKLAPGTTTLAIIVATPHREKGYEVNRFLLEEIKKKLPIWKKEVFVDGKERWVGWDNKN